MRRILPAFLVCLLLPVLAVAQGHAVQSPNGGESWALNSSHAITWSASSPSAGPTVSIVLIKGSTRLGFIAQNLSAATGSYSWTVGQYTGGPASAGTDYKIGLLDGSGNPEDTSNGFFSITSNVLPPPPPPVLLKLTAPNGGEQWKAGSSQTITWTSSNLPGKVKLELVREPNTTVGTIATNLAASGSLPWNAGDFQGGNSGPGDYRVRVTSLQNPARSDESDGKFTLKPAFRPQEMPRGALFAPPVKVPAIIQNWLGGDAFPKQYTIPMEQIRARPSCDAGSNKLAKVGRDWFPYQNIQLAALWRSRVSLNVEPLKNPAIELKSAKLRLKQISVVRTGTNDVSAAHRVCELKAPWTAFESIQLGSCYNLNPWEAEYTVDVTPTFRKWIDGSLPNHGLLLFARELPMSNPWTCISCFEATFELVQVQH